MTHRREYTDADFECFNTSSIEYILRVMKYDRTSEDDCAFYKDLLNRFVRWYVSNKTDGYMPSHGLCFMPRLYEFTRAGFG